MDQGKRKKNGKDIKIGVAVLQEPNGPVIQATLKRLIDYQKFSFTRGCLVRSNKISSNAAKAKEYLERLLSPKLGGAWVQLKSKDVKPLLAILFLLEARETYNLS